MYGTVYNIKYAQDKAGCVHTYAKDSFRMQRCFCLSSRKRKGIMSEDVLIFLLNIVSFPTFPILFCVF